MPVFDIHEYQSLRGDLSNFSDRLSRADRTKCPAPHRIFMEGSIKIDRYAVASTGPQQRLAVAANIPRLH